MKFGQNLELASVALRNVLLGGNLISLPLLKSPTRMVLYASESLFLYKALHRRRGLLEKNVFDVLAAQTEEPIVLGGLKGPENWFFSRSSFAADIINLSLISRVLKLKVVFEIGTLRGYTAFQIALNAPEDARIYTLDLPKDNATQPSLKITAVDDFHVKGHASNRHYAFEGTHVESRITCLFGDSATFDFSPYHGAVDFFFIDGAHSYDYVRSDTANALKCCHPGSVIAWHDFGRVGVNGVSKLVLEFAKTHDVFAVPGGSLAFTVLK